MPGVYVYTIDGYRFNIWRARLESEYPTMDVNPYVWFVKDLTLGYFEGNNFKRRKDAITFCELIAKQYQTEKEETLEK